MFQTSLFESGLCTETIETLQKKCSNRRSHEGEDLKPLNRFRSIERKENGSMKVEACCSDSQGSSQTMILVPYPTIHPKPRLNTSFAH